MITNNSKFKTVIKRYREEYIMDKLISLSRYPVLQLQFADAILREQDYFDIYLAGGPIAHIDKLTKNLEDAELKIKELEDVGKNDRDEIADLKRRLKYCEE